MLRVSSKLAD